MPNLDAAELDRLYNDANSCDEGLFSEMRSIILLVSGDHYTKKGSQFWDRIRNTKGLSESQKLRLTKNHTQTIVNDITSKVLSQAPNVTVTPNNMGEMQDQKTAELNKSVLEFYKRKHKLRKKIRSFAEDFVQQGECYSKIFWDDTKGEVIGYEQKIGEDGEPVYDENGEMEADETRPVMSGDFVFEKIHAFNLLRSPHTQDLEDSPYLIVRKMVEKETVKNMTDDPDKLKAIGNMDEETFLVFDGDTGTYDRNNKKIMLREHYYRPSMEYPNGYYYIAVKDRIIVEGELPFGIWPINGAGYNKIATSPRHRSPIKQIRPYQIEINRSASKIAETQITSDDKMVLTSGSKMSHGGELSGVRAITVTGGKDPKFLSGRSGEQYLPYMNSQIDELYQVMSVRELDEKGQFDPYAMLYFSARNKKKYKKYIEEFEGFVLDFYETFLKLAKHYLDESHIIPMIGKSEQVNIAEFKHTEPNSYRIRIEAVSDDIETMMGRQLSINHTLQYVGNSLEKEDIGRMMKAMPFMNYDEAFGDFTVNYDMSKNDMLAMERGEIPMINKYDPHKYLINQTVNRMKKADFKLLPPQIKEIYGQYIQAHEQAEADAMLAAQRAQEGFIPIDGPLVSVDYYITNDEGKTKRAKIPQRSLEWLEDHLEAQGTSLEKLTTMNTGAVQDISQMLEQQPQQPILPQGMSNQGLMPPQGM